MQPLDPLAIALRGTTLIEASAGTGKTHTITTLYLRLLLEGTLSVGNILVVTYTNAAAAELRTRIRRRLRAALAALEAGNDPSDPVLDRFVRQRHAAGAFERDRTALLAALHGFDEEAIFTIHGFCQRALQEHAFESGAPFDIELITNQVRLLEEVVQDFWVRELCAAPPPFVRYVRRKVTPEALAGLAAKAVLDPAMPVLPAQRNAACDDGLTEWRRAHAQAAAIWRRERARILHLVCTSSALKRTSYNVNSITHHWAPQMDVALAEECPGFSKNFKAFAKFTTATLAAQTKKECSPPQHAFFDACTALLAADEVVCEWLADRLLSFRRALVECARVELRRRKEAAHTQFFDDLLQRMAEALATAAGPVLADKIRTQFAAALIDEFQDTDPVQYGIFRRIYHNSEAALFLIGDPKQAIYAFRGADIFAYIAAKRAAGSRGRTLITNWRSDPSLIRAVNTLFGRARAQFLFEEIPFLPAQPRADASDTLGGSAISRAPLQILFMPSADNKTISKESGNQQLPEIIAAEIVRLLDGAATINGRVVVPGDIAVLCRTNEQASRMQVALRGRRVPSVLQTEASVFDSPEAVEVERLVRAIADPGDTGAVRAALATTLLGLSGNAIFALQEDERGWDAWMRRFQEWHDVWLRNGFVAAFHRVLEEHDVQARVLALLDGERRLTNVLHLGELLHGAELEERSGPLGLVRWLAQMRIDANARAELAGEATQIRLESDAAAVKLVTVHKAKGLEYPIVFCPYLWDGALLRQSDADCLRFHDPTDGYQLKLDLGSPDQQQHKRLAEREALAENLRLLYVALTRAKHRCTIVWGAFREARTSALGYLLHQPRPAPADAFALADATAARIQDLMAGGDARLRSDLEGLVHDAAGAIEITDCTPTALATYRATASAAPVLQCRTAARLLHPSWRVSSFSGLTATAREISQPAEEGQDRDESATGSPDPALLAPAVSAAPVRLHDFPRGTRAGELLHDIFEHLDFQQNDPMALQQQVSESLDRFGLDTHWADPLYQAIGEILDTPLGGPDALTLRHVALATRLSELEFVFPVSHGSSPPASHPLLLTRTRLAEVFARYATASLPPDYANRIRDLGFAPLAGFLKGFIDLVFERGGRWYVVDYKSNRLGPSAHDYAPSRLTPVMAGHHYFLQYHLYVLALHRYLAVRLPDYDYDRHFGGVYYLFLRGMAPAHPQGCGVFRDRPSRQCIAALSAVMEGSAAEHEGAAE